MSTFSRYEQAARRGAEFVRHVPCQRIYALAEMTPGDGIDDLGRLVCERCRAEGREQLHTFVVARPSVELQFPALFEKTFSKLPDALIDYGHMLGLKAQERALIAAIMRHQARRGTARLRYDRLALESGQSESSVKRYVASLSARDLLYVKHRHDAQGRQVANEYDLRPLWHQLRELLETGGQSGIRSAEGQSGPRSDAEEQPSTAGQSGPPPEANLAPPEVEAVEGDSVLRTGARQARAVSEDGSVETAPSPPQREANVNCAGDEDELLNGPPATVEPVPVVVELGEVAEVEPAAEPFDEAAVAEAVVDAGAGDGFAAARDGAGGGSGSGEGFGIGHISEDTPPRYDEFPAPKRRTLLDRLGSEDAVVAVVAAAFDATEIEDERPDPERRREELLAKGDELARILRARRDANGGRSTW